MKEFFEFKNKKRFLQISFFLALSLFTSYLFFSLVSKYSSELSAANVLSNPSFTGGSTGWSLSRGASYDATVYQDSAGSLKGAADGRKTTTTGYGDQTISTTIQGGSTVYLNLNWAKQCVAVNCEWNEIYVRVSYSGGAYSDVWSNTSNPAFGSRTSWTAVTNLNISSYFTSTGSYTIRLYYNMRTANNASAGAYGWLDNLNLDVITPNITVGTTGSQTSTVTAGTSNFYIGGAFTFVRSASSTSVTSITISETGTISDANISGLILYYKQEATCSTTFPTGTTQFNSTPGSFSSGSSTVTGTMTVGTSQICVYVEVDIGSGASPTETIEIQITNPSTQVTASAGTVSPATAVAISGTTTVVANQAPSFTVFSDNGPVDPGSNVTFSSTASDPDADTIKLVVCKTQGVTGTACDGGSGDTWCTSSLVSSNPSCQYSVPSVTPDDDYNTYPYVFDSKNLGSSSVLQGALDTYTVNNVAPVVSAVTINGGSAINLTAGTTKSVTLTATVSDNNSCYGSEISSVLGYVYRSGITYTGCDIPGEANNNFCYPEITCTVVGGTCTDTTDSSANYTCTLGIYSYADPTDTGTLYPTEYWMDTIKATDDDTSAAYTEVSPGVKLNSLLGFNITTSVNYGSLNVNQSNDPLDRTTTITPTGNVGLDHELSGPTNMCTDFPTCAGGTIAIGYQKYALSASTAYSSGIVLTTTATEAETNVPKPITGTPTTKTIWWGMLVPTNTSPGSYDGSIMVTGVKGETANW